MVFWTAECRTPQNAQTYCSVTSSQPVTMAAYTLGNLIDNLHNIQDPPLAFNPIGDPALVYIPPANSYLNSYSLSTAKNLTTQFQGFISYILPTRIFDNSPQERQRFRVNGETYIPDQYEAINCLVGGSNEVCAYGATRFLGIGNFDLSYDNIEGGAFWGFTYGYAREVSLCLLKWSQLDVRMMIQSRVHHIIIGYIITLVGIYAHFKILANYIGLHACIQLLQL